MFGSRKRSVDGVDLSRLNVAYHELGHYVVWRELTGARIRFVTVTGCGRSTSGTTRVSWPTDDGGALDRGYLVGLLAGSEADKERCRRTGQRLDTSGWSHDLSQFRRTRRQHAPSRAWSESSLRAEARRVVLGSWREIERLAPELAQRGRL